MYNNVGRSIKTLAKIIAFIGVAISVIGAFIIMAPAGNLSYYSNELAGTLICTGLLIGILGSLLSVVLSFFMYGFGQLIDSAQNIEKKIVFEKSLEDIKYENDTNSVEVKFCEKCGERLEYNAKFCSDCGEVVK